MLSAVSFTSTTKSSPVIVTGKNDVVINLFYSGKNTLTYSKDVPMVDIRTDDIINVRVNLIKTDDKAQIKNSGQAAAGFNSALPHDGLDAKKSMTDPQRSPALKPLPARSDITRIRQRRTEA